MASTNLYASRVYKEHPIVSWPLDDEIYFSDLVGDEYREETGWQGANCSSTTLIELPESPFPDSPIVSWSASTTDPYIYTVPSLLLNSSTLNQGMGSYSSNIYFFSQGAIDQIEFGVQNSEADDQFYLVEEPSNRSWIRLGGDFDIVDSPTNEVTFVIRVTFADDSSDLDFVVNGFSVGQWSEIKSEVSLGVIPEIIPEEILGPDVYGYPTLPYGVYDGLGYFIYDDNRFLARNVGVPMVYGSDNVTRLAPSPSGLPSLVVPSDGMLTESGKYNTYTMEFWLRIDPNSEESQRIWGPVDSDYGLYVNESSLILLIGDKFVSHFIGIWYRPILVHVTVRPDGADLFVNEILVGSMSYDLDDLYLPESDWHGWYCYEDQKVHEIDCISYSPYKLSPEAIKRRFVWGQGVPSLDRFNKFFDGNTATIDYPYAEYTTDKIYPDVDKWSSGAFQNVNVTDNHLETPQYELPTMFRSSTPFTELETKTFYEDNKTINDNPDYYGDAPLYFKFKPSARWNEEYYASFPFDLINEPTKGVYGVFEVDDNNFYDGETQTLMKIFNSSQNKSVDIRLSGDQVLYTFSDNTGEKLFHSETIQAGQMFSVGLNIPEAVRFLGLSFTKMFFNPDALKVYVGGIGQNTFAGKVYCFGLMNELSIEKLEDDVWNQYGVLASDTDIYATNFSYTVFANSLVDRYFLDIGVYSSWKDYCPLSYFASYTEDENGTVRYDMDFIQFNIGSTYIARDITRNVNYDFSQSDVRTFITFQQAVLNPNKRLRDYEDFVTISGPVLDATEYINPIDTAFEIVDNTVIFPPTGWSVDSLSMSVNIEIDVRGIYKKPVKLRRMHLSSKTLPQNGFDKIGTRYSQTLNPYSRIGEYYSYSTKNPYMMYKDSTPYLYLTEYSGIESVGGIVSDYDRGISMPFNQSNQEKFTIQSLQLWINYKEEPAPQEKKKLFELDWKEGNLFFNIESDASGQRAMITVEDPQRKYNTSVIEFYQDGERVINPKLELNKWTVVGVYFNKPLENNYYTGSLNLLQGAVFNNISIYKMTFEQEAKTYYKRLWLDVRRRETPYFDWQYWKGFDPGPYRTWDEVKRSGVDRKYGIQPNDIFATYIGTNIDVIGDDEGITIENSGLTSYTGIEWYDYFKRSV